MSDKLLSYLDTFPEVVSIWVNDKLEYTTGPVEGFTKMSRDEALQACMYTETVVDTTESVVNADPNALTPDEITVQKTKK